MPAPGAASGFVLDARFAGAMACDDAPPVVEGAPSDDPVALAYADGFAAGAAEARAQADERAAGEAQSRERLALSFARLDAALEEQLRQRLRDTVAALCDSVLAPHALDPDALMRRIETAVSMLSRVDDERVIRLHPDDLALVSPRLSRDWTVKPDPALERGALRVETASGGVEDGPEQWRRAIAEALRAC